jgi:hypothetical protein
MSFFTGFLPWRIDINSMRVASLRAGSWERQSMTTIDIPISHSFPVLLDYLGRIVVVFLYSPFLNKMNRICVGKREPTIVNRIDGCILVSTISTII